MSPRPGLRALAERLGIVSEYRDVEARSHATSDATREALIAAMGFDGSSEEGALAEIARLAGEAEPALPDGPDSCFTAEEALGSRRLVGICLFLATIPSERSQSAGDFTDLAEIAESAARAGAGFVGLNPLHAVRHRGDEVSPYSPLSRLFRDALYLDVEAVPELAGSAEARAILGSEDLRAELARLRSGDHVQHEAVMRAKRRVLEAIHGSVVMRSDESRDDLLEAFATFCAIDDVLMTRGVGDWHDWPDDLRDPRGEGVRRFRQGHAREIAFHAWVQGEIDRQLSEAARRAREAGMPLGLYQDLALGSARAGFDTWYFRELFLDGASVGAPPDPLGPEGQDWSFPPVDPRRLEATGFDYFARVLRASFAHSGALRIDHVLGLVRQFWIPRGRPASEGAYVRQPTEALLRVVARESRIARALVVGEDLGTVPEELPALLERWGVLSTRVLYFQRDATGEFLPSAQYPERALVTGTTHDLPPLLGWWEGSDLSLRRDLGLVASDGELASLVMERDRDKSLLLRRLASEGLDAAARSPESVRDAIHAFLRRTPCRLVGLWLDDLAGETRPLNVPGIPQSAHSSWTRKTGTGTSSGRLEVRRGDLDAWKRFLSPFSDATGS